MKNMHSNVRMKKANNVKYLTHTSLGNFKKHERDLGARLDYES